MLKGKLAIVVEDEAIVALDTSTRLQRMGMEVIACVARADEAVAACAERRPDIALMDVRLRGPYDGIDAAHELRARWGIPSIFVTAYTDESSIARIAEAEPYGYMLKPIHDAALWVTVHAALQRLEQERARAVAELERRRVDGRYREILEHSHDGIVTVDGEQRILVYNRGAENIFGWSIEEALGQHLDLLLPEATRARHRSFVGSVVEGRVVSRPMTLREVEGRRRGGETFPVEVSLSRLSIEGEPMITAIVRDLTERRRIESQVHHAQKLETLGRLATGIAHDFNNQLVPITGYSELLLDSFDEHDPRRADALEVKAAADRATRLTRQLLIFGRKDVERTEAFSADEELSKLRGMLPRLLGADVQIAFDLAAPGALLQLDPTAFEQVVINLVVNARDAMPGGGRVDIRTRVVGREVVPHGGGTHGERFVLLQVEDAGSGIAPEDQERIFEPFYTTKPTAAGTGLGLATVQGILRRAGGRIALDSEVGRGSLFEVFLPIGGSGAATGDPDELARRRTPTPVERRRRAAVVDDDEDVRRFASRVLADLGYDVVLVGGATDMPEESVEELDLLVTDVVMSQGSGMKFAAAMRRRTQCRVLYVTGYSDDELLRRGLTPGAALLRKPFGARELEEAVGTVMAGRSRGACGG